MTFEEAAAMARVFRSERDWEQFHNPKDLAMSISIEAAELLECFQWSGSDLTVIQKQKQMSEELADIAIYCIYMADALGINLAECVDAKIGSNEKKYPVDKSRGSARKYTELEL